MPSKYLLLSFLFCFSLQPTTAQDYITLGKPGTETFQDITVLSNGDFTIAGKTRAQGAGSDDMSLTFFSTDGKLKYCNTYGKEKSDIPFALHTAKNGDVLMVGQGFEKVDNNGSSVILYRLDKFGKQIWKQVLKGRSGYAVTELENGNIAVGGYLNSDFSLAIVSENGNILLEGSYGTDYKDYAFGLLETSDNGYLIGGIKAGFHSPEGHDMNIPDSDLLFIKVREDGVEQWRKEEGEAGHDFFSQMMTDGNGNIYVVGSTQGDGKQSFDAFLMKMDEEANIIWKELVGGTDFEYGLDLAMDANGNIYICGATNSNTTNENPDLFAAKFDPLGNELWYKQLGSSASEYANGIAISNTQEVLVIGSSSENNETEYLMAKLDTEGDLLSVNPLSSEGQLLLLSPNPTPGIVVLGVVTNLFCQDFTYTLYNMEGQLLSHQKAQGTTVLDLSHLPSGMYIVVVLLEDGTELSEKIMRQ
ncbi:MAG: hypothetical protein ACI8YQ_001805 [Polaribacter sp.]|jgi:hypothetical protein